MTGGEALGMTGNVVSYNAAMDWLDETREGVRVFIPGDVPLGVAVGFSGRGHAPDGEPTPTVFLARRLAAALGLDQAPIAWAKQVHGDTAATVRAQAAPAASLNVGECDALATDRPGVALVVQTADCVPILLSGNGAVGAAHAGWRGSARNVAASAVAALRGLGSAPESLRAWLGPSIGPCCYEVGGEVAAQFARDFVRAGGGGGGFRLDLRGVNAAQLAEAGIPREAIAVHPACTKCGGDKFASWRRDGANAGRMIALISRVS
jgi:YfiH family protein